MVEIVMEKSLENQDFNIKDANVETMIKKTTKCNQCDYTIRRLGDLRMHLKSLCREKSFNCNRCDYASSLSGNLRVHPLTQHL